MSAKDDRKRSSHARPSWRRRRATRTLVLLEYPDENGLPGQPIEPIEPIETAGPPRHVERRGHRRALAIAAGLVVATGAIAGGSMALASGGGPATAPRTPAPDRVVIPKSPDAAPMFSGLASVPAMQSATPSVSPTVSQTPSAPPPTTAAAPSVMVIYTVDDRSFDGFQAEVDVINQGSVAVSDWRIFVALPQDHFESWSGASGDVRDGTLILRPQFGSGPLEPGQALRVSFQVSGGETTPVDCAFNNVACQRF